MNTNDNFRKQLNNASRDIEDVLKEQNNQMINEMHNQARYDYNCIKKKLLYEVSQGNFKKINDEKYVSCLYEANHFQFSYFYDDGLRIKNRVFGVKTIDTGVVTYSPRQPDKWEIYINEIKRLGNEECVAIYAVIKSDMYNVTCPYPTKTSDKRFKIYCGTSLCLKCTAKF